MQRVHAEGTHLLKVIVRCNIHFSFLKKINCLRNGSVFIQCWHFCVKAPEPTPPTLMDGLQFLVFTLPAVALSAVYTYTNYIYIYHLYLYLYIYSSTFQYNKCICMFTTKVY